MEPSQFLRRHMTNENRIDPSTTGNPAPHPDDTPPPRRKELAALKTIAVFLVILALVGVFFILAMIEQPRLRTWYFVTGSCLLLSLAPIGVGIAGRKSWARVLFYWVSFPLVGLFWPLSLIVWGGFGILPFMVVGGYLLEPRVKSFFKPSSLSS